MKVFELIEKLNNLTPEQKEMDVALFDTDAFVYYPPNGLLKQADIYHLGFNDWGTEEEFEIDGIEDTKKTVIAII